MTSTAAQRPPTLPRGTAVRQPAVAGAPAAPRSTPIAAGSRLLHHRRTPSQRSRTWHVLLSIVDYCTGLARFVKPKKPATGRSCRYTRALLRRSNGTRSKPQRPKLGRPASHAPHAAALVRHAVTREWLRHTNGPGASWSQGCPDDHDLHPRLEPWRKGGSYSRR